MSTAWESLTGWVSYSKYIIIAIICISITLLLIYIILKIKIMIAASKPKINAIELSELVIKPNSIKP